MRLILVLGMHRSGTSCLTGLLENAGVHLGEVARQNPHNLKGNNENRAAMELNQEVLAAAGAEWKDPPAGAAPWSSGQLDRARSILADILADDRPAALKDPRCVFTGEGWRQAAADAGAEAGAIGTFRRPERVVGSLRARGPHLSEDLCFDLWRRYNERLLELHAADPFPIVDFDRPVDDYLAGVERAFSVLDLPPPTGELFFSDELRRQDDDGADRPELETLYRRLVAAAG